MVLVTGLYVMMNVAYFTMLTPEEFIATDTVALVSHFYQALVCVFNTKFVSGSNVMVSQFY